MRNKTRNIKTKKNCPNFLELSESSSTFPERGRRRIEEADGPLKRHILRMRGRRQACVGSLKSPSNSASNKL